MFSLSASVGSCGTFLDISLSTFALALLRWSKVYPQICLCSQPRSIPKAYSERTKNDLVIHEVWRYPNLRHIHAHNGCKNTLLPAVPYKGPAASHHILAGSSGQQVDASWSCSFTEGWKCLDCNAIRMFLPRWAFKASTFNCGNSIETMQKPNWKQSPYTGTNERKMKQVGPGWLNMLTVGELDLSTSPSPMLKAGVVPFPMVKFRVSVMVFQSVCNWIQ